jgi:hypothetical protein
LGKGVPAALEVKLPPKFGITSTIKYSTAQQKWAELGVVQANGAVLPGVN